MLRNVQVGVANKKAGSVSEKAESKSRIERSSSLLVWERITSSSSNGSSVVGVRNAHAILKPFSLPYLREIIIVVT